MANLSEYELSDYELIESKLRFGIMCGWDEEVDNVIKQYPSFLNIIFSDITEYGDDHGSSGKTPLEYAVYQVNKLPNNKVDKRQRIIKLLSQLMFQ